MSDLKEKIELEFIIKTSPSILYNRLSTPSGLSEWFSDDVNVKGNIYTFIWDGAEQEAELLNKKENTSIKFHWLDDDDEDAYFEFIINVDELTGETALMIIDFAEEDEKEDSVELWNQQIDQLKHCLGSN
ncbi:START-like domain-containing protein [Plebeiibacterium sediminum]|uniref:START-like domain-containing protein n=1 Tax=Plebeiibacterium sediminum TaxID=2992112 RepID=A0AAE3SES7_9BACT|nr:START-like domain-containing protein [Plebeiobacterium sediminum]MCW3786705.1 START-like domain-containing protein [Plebeiobacterium sediminum]